MADERHQAQATMTQALRALASVAHTRHKPSSDVLMDITVVTTEAEVERAVSDGWKAAMRGLMRQYASAAAQATDDDDGGADSVFEHMRQPSAAFTREAPALMKVAKTMADFCTQRAQDHGLDASSSTVGRSHLLPRHFASPADRHRAMIALQVLRREADRLHRALRRTPPSQSSTRRQRAVEGRGATKRSRQRRRHHEAATRASRGANELRRRTRLRMVGARADDEEARDGMSVRWDEVTRACKTLLLVSTRAMNKADGLAVDGDDKNATASAIASLTADAYVVEGYASDSRSVAGVVSPLAVGAAMRVPLIWLPMMLSSMGSTLCLSKADVKRVAAKVLREKKDFAKRYSGIQRAISTAALACRDAQVRALEHTAGLNGFGAESWSIHETDVYTLSVATQMVDEETSIGWQQRASIKARALQHRLRRVHAVLLSHIQNDKLRGLVRLAIPPLLVITLGATSWFLALVSLLLLILEGAYTIWEGSKLE